MDIRELSKLLFGNRYMLEVCRAIGERSPGRVNLASIIGARDVSASLYSGPLRRLHQAGLVIDAPHSDDDHRERWYEPVDLEFWSAAIDLSGRIQNRGSV